MINLRLLALAAALLLVAACAEDADTTGEEVADDIAEEGEAQPEEEEEEEAGEDPADETAGEDDGAEVAVADSALGDILVDADGLTLYLFDNDEAGESTCYGDCETNWPPLLTEGDPVAGERADADLLGKTERDDGSLQVTYDEQPLYYWVGDEEAGDVAGQAVQDVWWVLDPGGEAIRDEGAEAGSDEDDEGGGY